MFQIRFRFFLDTVEVDDSPGFCWRKEKRHHIQGVNITACASSKV